MQHGATLFTSRGFHYRTVTLALDVHLLLHCEQFLIAFGNLFAGWGCLQMASLMLITSSHVVLWQPFTVPWVLKVKVFRGLGKIEDLNLVVFRCSFYESVAPTLTADVFVAWRDCMSCDCFIRVHLDGRCFIRHFLITSVFTVSHYFSPPRFLQIRLFSGLKGNFELRLTGSHRVIVTIVLNLVLLDRGG